MTCNFECFPTCHINFKIIPRIKFVVLNTDKKKKKTYARVGTFLDAESIRRKLYVDSNSESIAILRP